MLQEKIPELLDYIEKHQNYLKHNDEVLDIFNGNPLQYVLADMEKSLSAEYFKAVKHRAVAINVLRRLVDKSAKSYEEPPIRKVKGSAQDKELVDEYVKMFSLDEIMNDADEYCFLHKGYSLEPFIHEDEPKLRVLTYNQFLPYSNDSVDPTNMTIFIKMMGKKPVYTGKGKKEVELREVYFAYSNDEFIAFDSSQELYAPAMEENEGDNLVGEIPIMYANRGKNQLIPTQDTDTLSLSKVIPIFLSDLSGTIMYQCFSVIWGIDVDLENMKYSPNAIWSIKSDAAADKQPQVGTIKPEADIDKVMSFIVNVFLLWMDTKGIKAGSIGDLSVGNIASGIAKAIDEMDSTAIIRKSMKYFQKEEPAFWSMMKAVHNYWVDSGQVKGKGKFSDKFSVTLEFDNPEPMIDREKEFRTIEKEVNAGYDTPENAIKKLYPKLSDREVAKRLAHYNEWNSMGEVNGMDEDENTDTQGLQEERAKSNSKGNN